jgi:hypothetical protein
MPSRELPRTLEVLQKFGGDNLRILRKLGLREGACLARDAGGSRQPLRLIARAHPAA